ncbi:MAG: hypothetical protein ABW134_11790 [Candidatus Thiodiazotropha endolucinida]
MNIRPITHADFIEMTGDAPTHSLRGYACEHEDRIIGIAGVLHSRPLIAFSLLKPEIKSNRRVIVEAIKRFRDLLKSYDAQIIAIPDEREETANRFLKHVGFKLDGGYFVWDQ